jgi:hypothetical protein
VSALQVLAVDPGSTHTGVAAAHLEGADVQLDRVASVNMLVDDRRSLARIRDAFGPNDYIDGRLLIEEVPPTAHKDTGHGSQAPIGFRQGYIAGIIAGDWYGDGGRAVELVSSSVWRPSMIVYAARRGLLLDRPRGRKPSPFDGRQGVLGTVDKVDKATPPATGFVVSWRGCTHLWPAADLAAVVNKPERCPECFRSARKVDPARAAAEQVRDDWKRTAYMFASFFWPDPIAAVVEDARSRAKTVRIEPWRLAGVADACEAVGLAVHGLSAEKA